MSYQGSYSPAMVPMFERPPGEALDYPKLGQPKAMAIRPSGPRIKIANGQTLAEAEAKALAQCNEGDSPYPCFLYAANERVILSQRRTEPER